MNNELEASRGIVARGYVLPLVRLPDPVFCRDHASTIGEGAFVSEEIAKLIVASCALEVSECPKVYSPLLVVRNSGFEDH